MGDMRNADKILVGKPEGEGYSENLDVDGKSLLERILGEQELQGGGLDAPGLRRGTFCGLL